MNKWPELKVGALIKHAYPIVLLN
ncbi:hypothetical protein AGR13a_Lc100169 [Agrobacterium genomosp. 13 str. CFBP 6927]|uniref:Uncharacterized protein n=1 Tax=Agrobacterium genomosp. 13 str. CFBP 6927 TaxID=1183428 RepID=A0ABP2BN94_9HYPH|nr:hypothetical protein AGR13a_Lc100169 [Agrobacterium genomosp. 13 str. CFBP 6927]